MRVQGHFTSITDQVRGCKWSAERSFEWVVKTKPEWSCQIMCCLLHNWVTITACQVGRFKWLSLLSITANYRLSSCSSAIMKTNFINPLQSLVNGNRGSSDLCQKGDEWPSLRPKSTAWQSVTNVSARKTKHEISMMAGNSVCHSVYNVAARLQGNSLLQIWVHVHRIETPPQEQGYSAMVYYNELHLGMQSINKTAGWHSLQLFFTYLSRQNILPEV